MSDPIIEQMRVISKLQAEIYALKEKVEELKDENSVLTKNLGDLVRRPGGRHFKIRKRKDGEVWRPWGTVMDVVRKSKHLSCREIVEITGFDRYAVYAAARRAGIKLKPNRE